MLEEFHMQGRKKMVGPKSRVPNPASQLTRKARHLTILNAMSVKWAQAHLLHKIIVGMALKGPAWHIASIQKCKLLLLRTHCAHVISRAGGRAPP